jgi:hypothetical protein
MMSDLAVERGDWEVPIIADDLLPVLLASIAVDS